MYSFQRTKYFCDSYNWRVLIFQLTMRRNRKSPSFASWKIRCCSWQKQKLLILKCKRRSSSICKAMKLDSQAIFNNISNLSLISFHTRIHANKTPLFSCMTMWDIQKSLYCLCNTPLFYGMPSKENTSDSLYYWENWIYLNRKLENCCCAFDSCCNFGSTWLTTEPLSCEVTWNYSVSFKQMDRYLCRISHQFSDGSLALIDG